MRCRERAVSELGFGYTAAAVSAGTCPPLAAENTAPTPLLSGADAEYHPLTFGTVHLHEGRGKGGKPMSETAVWDLLMEEEHMEESEDAMCSSARTTPSPCVRCPELGERSEIRTRSLPCLPVRAVPLAATNGAQSHSCGRPSHGHQRGGQGQELPQASNVWGVRCL